MSQPYGDHPIAPNAGGGNAAPGYFPAFPPAFPPASAPMSSATAMPQAIGWTVVAWIFFFPLGIAALLNHVAVAPAWYAGDVVGAQHFADRARRHGITALCIGVVIVALYGVLIAVLVVNGVSSSQSCVDQAGYSTPC